MPSWHSGYEEFDWEPVGKPVLKHLIGTRTYKGTSALAVTNTAEGNVCASNRRNPPGRGAGISPSVSGRCGRVFRAAGLEGFGTTQHTSTLYPFVIRLGDLEHTIEIGTVTKIFTWEFTAPKTEVVELSLLLAGRERLCSPVFP